MFEKLMAAFWVNCLIQVKKSQKKPFGDRTKILCVKHGEAKVNNLLKLLQFKTWVYILRTKGKLRHTVGILASTETIFRLII